MVLVKEYARRFCLKEAMEQAGYRGSGRIFEAVRDIEEHADILRSAVTEGAADRRRERILAEYEKIAFAGEDDGIRTADKLKALEMYRALSETGRTATDASLVVNYDYGDDGE